MKDCPACLRANPEDVRFCSSCGYDLRSDIPGDKTKIAETPVTQFSTGNQIANRYEVVKELGRGGMGVVYLVKDTRLQNRQVALKMIHPQLVENPQARQRFEQEVGTCLDLMHPNIVRVHNLEEWQGHQYFTMEYIPGRSLREMITERKDKNSSFTLPEAVLIISSLLDALSYAHKFTIHRDIKPENIVVIGRFPHVSIKVLNFGIAKTMTPSQSLLSSRLLGTPYYIAPEQNSGGVIDQRADLYSVGMVFYELLTGKLLVGRCRLLSEMVPGLSTEVDAVLEKALAPAPEQRYKSSEQMNSALKLLVAIRPTHPDHLKEERPPSLLAAEVIESTDATSEKKPNQEFLKQLIKEAKTDREKRLAEFAENDIIRVREGQNDIERLSDKIQPAAPNEKEISNLPEQKEIEKRSQTMKRQEPVQKQQNQVKGSQKEAREDSLNLDFMDFMYGWLPVVGHVLAIINFMMGKRKRAVFFLIYSTLGLLFFLIKQSK
jgi:serine/threonine protein kinase